MSTLALNAPKLCKGCAKSKPLADFSRDRNGKSGYKSQCRTCLTSQKRISRHKNPIPNREACKRWQTKNKEKAKGYWAAYRARARLNPELQKRRRQNYSKWAQAHPEKVVEHGRRAYLKKYGISLEDYEVRLSSQNSVCAICKKSESQRLAVDHCHITGQIRGLLCRHCNTALGHFFDSPTNLRSAASYLEKTST